MMILDLWNRAECVCEYTPVMKKNQMKDYTQQVNLK